MTETARPSWRQRFAGDSMNTGWGRQLEDRRDSRDKTWEDAKCDHEELRRRVDGSGSKSLEDDDWSPVRDQGMLDACVGFALASLVEFLQQKRGLRQRICSPRFIWYLARLYDLRNTENTGAQLRNGMRVLAHVGATPEWCDPYDPVAFMPPPPAESGYQLDALLNEAAARRPTQEAISAASRYAIDTYYRLESLEEYKDCLDHGYGFVMSVPMFQSVIQKMIEDESADFPMPTLSLGQPQGWHTLFVVGYQDDATHAGGGYLRCKASQGDDRGHGGYFNVPYEYVRWWRGDAWTAIMFASEKKKKKWERESKEEQASNGNKKEQTSDHNHRGGQ